jgi:hypothetical protein
MDSTPGSTSAAVFATGNAVLVAAGTARTGEQENVELLGCTLLPILLLLLLLLLRLLLWGNNQCVVLQTHSSVIVRCGSSASGLHIAAAAAGSPAAE